MWEFRANAKYPIRNCGVSEIVAIEQDRRRIKQRVRPMLGFKRFETAAVTIRGIELTEKIKKRQITFLTPRGKIVTLPAVWAFVRAA